MFSVVRRYAATITFFIFIIESNPNSRVEHLLVRSNYAKNGKETAFTGYGANLYPFDRKASSLQGTKREVSVT